MNFLHNIAHLIVKAVAIPLVFVLSSVGYSAPIQNTQPTFGAFSVSGGGTYRLRTTAGSSDTSIQLSSFKEPISNIPYTMTQLGTTIGYGTLDPQQPTRSEFISFTGITQNSDGTAALTGVTRGIPRSPGSNPGSCNTASTTLRQAHAGQSIFILSDSPCLFSQFAIKQNDELISGAWTASSTNPWKFDNDFTIGSTTRVFAPVNWVVNNFLDIRKTGAISLDGTYTFSAKPVFSIVPTSSQAPSVGSDVVNKTYADGLAIAGSPNASTIAKGIVEIATSAEILAGTGTGSTGAVLAISPDGFATAYGSAFASVISTTTVQNLATTTFKTSNGTLPTTDTLSIQMTVPYTVGSGATTSSNILMAFNGDFSTIYTQEYFTGVSGLNGLTSTSNLIIDSKAGNLVYQRYINMKINNFVGSPKFGDYLTWAMGTTTPTNTVQNVTRGTFVYGATPRITQIDIWHNNVNVLFGTTTQVKIIGY